MENDQSSPLPSAAASPYWQVPPTRQSEGFSPFVAFCFTINYILGTGFLTIPWAFTQGGLLLSAILLNCVGIFSDMAKNYLLESLARAEAMLDVNMHWIKNNQGQSKKPLPLLYSQSLQRDPDDSRQGYINYNSMSADIRLQSIPALLSPSTPPSTSMLQQSNEKYCVKSRKFEVNVLCRIFLGKVGLNLYTLFICLYIYCTLWAYTSVFSSALARTVPVFQDDYTNYTAYAILFSAIVVPLSCLELDEQVTVQVTLTICRFLMLATMLLTAETCAKQASSKNAKENVLLFRPEGIHKMLPIIVFAHIYHHSIPGLSHPVKDKRKLKQIFQATCIFTTIAYTAVGLVLGSAFGLEDIEQSSNLNWQNYQGGTITYDENGLPLHGISSWWFKAISYYVVLFPAADVVSAFPLNAITLGNNLMGSFFGRRLHEFENNRIIRIQFRLLAACPPILLGLLVRELGKITDYAGTTGFIIGFSFPALLYLRSRQKADRNNFSTSTLYESYASSKPLAVLLLSFGIIMLTYVTFFLVLGS